MSNFQILDRDNLEDMLDTFAPGMSDHVTPIKYEALTPDLFMLLFRTTARDDQDHYFVLCEFDYMKDHKEAQKQIEAWHGGKLIDFWPISYDKEAYSTPYGDGVYSVTLAEVERPKGDGYWATNFYINPGDDIDKKLEYLSAKDKQNIKKGLVGAMNSSTANSDVSSLEDWQDKVVFAEDLKTNDSDLAFSVFKKSDDGYEFFYNRVKDKDS